MDLNQLLHRHQTSLMRAANARGTDLVTAYRREADCLAERIRALRSAMGATNTLALPVA